MPWSLDSAQWWEGAANAAQFFALLGAAVFFAVKVYQGYLTVDLSLPVACQRNRSLTGGHDDLIINITIKRGDRGSVRLRDLVVWVSGDGIETELFHLDEIRRLEYRDDGEILLPGEWRQGKMPYLQLTPNETMTVARHVSVPTTIVAVIEVALQSEKRRVRNLGQWRSTAVSLPVGSVGNDGGRHRQ